MIKSITRKATINAPANSSQSKTREHATEDARSVLLDTAQRSDKRTMRRADQTKAKNAMPPTRE